jgi:type III secretion protein U
MGEKTEKATPKKLRDAKKKGQIAKAQDFPSSITFIASIAITMSMSMYLYGQFGKFLIAAFKHITAPDLTGVIIQFFYQSIQTIFICSIPVMGLVAIIGMLANLMVTGPMFAPEVFKFDIKKFDPIQNLKSKFKMKTLIELLKQMFKIGIAGYICYTVVLKSIPVLTKTVGLPITAALIIFHAFLMEVIIKVGMFFIFVAIADLMYQKHAFAKEMKMEKFEIKQEYKNSEGDPQIKGKRKQIAHEIAYQEGPAAGVKRAQAVVTNPTHLAIAIGYKQESDAAPYIVAMGEGTNAAQIVKLAEQYGIPVMRNIGLARKLWDTSDLYEYVPEDTYEVVAEILRWVASVQDATDRPSETES